MQKGRAEQSFTSISQRSMSWKETACFITVVLLLKGLRNPSLKSIETQELQGEMCQSTDLNMVINNARCD